MPGVAIFLVMLAFAEGAFDALPDPPVETEPGEMLTEANRLYARGETTAALALLQRAQQAWGTTAAYLVAVARIELAAGRWAEAERTLVRALEQRFEELGRPLQEWSPPSVPSVPSSAPGQGSSPVPRVDATPAASRGPIANARPLQLFAGPLTPRETEPHPNGAGAAAPRNPLTIPGDDDPIVRAGFLTLANLEMQRAEAAAWVGQRQPEQEAEPVEASPLGIGVASASPSSSTSANDSAAVRKPRATNNGSPAMTVAGEAERRARHYLALAAGS